MVSSSGSLAETLADQVRELLARSHRITRRSAILVESSRRVRERESLITHCAWCGRVRVGGDWAQPEELPGFLFDVLQDRRTHGICSACLDEGHRQAPDAPLPATVVVIRAPGPMEVECLSRTLESYRLRERPHFAIEAALPDGAGPTLSALLSKVSACLDENRLGPVTVELSDRTYVLGEGPRAPGAAG